MVENSAVRVAVGEREGTRASKEAHVRVFWTPIGLLKTLTHKLRGAYLEELDSPLERPAWGEEESAFLHASTCICRG